MNFITLDMLVKIASNIPRSFKASSVSNHKWIGKTANISLDSASLILPSEHGKKERKSL